MQKILIILALTLSACSFAPIPGVSDEQVQAIPTGSVTEAPFGCVEGKSRGVQC